MITINFNRKVEFVQNLKKRSEEQINEDIEKAIKMKLERFELQELLNKYEIKANVRINGFNRISVDYTDKNGHWIQSPTNYCFKILVTAHLYEEKGKYYIKHYIDVEPDGFDHICEYIKALEKDLKERFGK